MENNNKVGLDQLSLKKLDTMQTMLAQVSCDNPHLKEVQAEIEKRVDRTKA